MKKIAFAVIALIAMNCSSGSKREKQKIISQDQDSSKRDSGIIANTSRNIKLSIEYVEEQTDTVRMLLEPCNYPDNRENFKKVDSIIQARSPYTNLCPSTLENIVIVTYLVDTLGNPGGFKVLKSTCPKLNTEAIKIIKLVKFKYIICEGKPLHIRMSYKFDFAKYK